MVSNGAQPEWEATAAKLAPRLWGSLCARNARSPVCLAMLEDLPSGELTDGLEGILGRAMESEDLDELLLLMPVAVGFTVLKRRRVNDALRQPWLIQERPLAKLFSERELLQARIAAKVPGGVARDFPIARRVARRSRDEVRAAVVDRIGVILTEAKLPAAEIIKNSTAPLKLLLRLGAGLRTNTLKSKLRTYEKMKRWLDSVYGIFFVESPVQAMDYLTDRADEPCGSSIPGDVVGMINFFENLGNRPTSERVASSGLLRNLVSRTSGCASCRQAADQEEGGPILGGLRCVLGNHRDGQGTAMVRQNAGLGEMLASLGGPQDQRYGKHFPTEFGAQFS